MSVNWDIYPWNFTLFWRTAAIRNTVNHILIYFTQVYFNIIILFPSCLQVIAKKLFIQELCFLLNCDFNRHKLCGTWSHTEWDWKVVWISIVSVTKMNTVLFSLSVFLRKHSPVSSSTVWVLNNHHCAVHCHLKDTRN